MSIEQKVADAIWDEFCPGIRRTEEDNARYLRGAKAAIKSISKYLLERQPDTTSDIFNLLEGKSK